MTLPDQNANSYTIRGLDEWCEYGVRVAAYNKVGNSTYSEEAKERTREHVPSAPPSNITIADLNSTAIKVTWDPVPLADQNGQIKGYKVKYLFGRDCYLLS